MEVRLRHCGTTLQHTTKRILGASGGCVPPAQEPWRGTPVALLTGCQKTNLRDEINPDNRHVAALNVGVPLPPVARDYELSVNVGKVGKLCKRHRLPFSRARQRILPFSIHSLLGV